MVDPPTFEEWLTPEKESTSQEMTQIGAHYFDRGGNAISFAESMWIGITDPGNSIIRHTHYPEDGLVSTAHLHFNHAGLGQPVLIFETMVFRVDGWEDYQERYTTETEAIVGHEATVVRVDAGLEPEY